MKKVITVLLLAAMLSGCGTQETFETVEDVIPAEPAAVQQQFFVSLPEEAATPTFQDDSSELYVCQDYTITKQVMESGDLAGTLQILTGKTAEELDVICTACEDYDRYDFVWASAGEDGLQVGRACILDDGAYHYTLSAMAEETASGQLRQTIQEVFDSCKLIDPEVNLRTGS